MPDPEAFNLFMQQISGSKNRSWPQGRISGEDDGATAYAIAADPQRKLVLIKFTKPMDWLGLGIEEAKALRDKLTEKINELQKLSV